MDGMRLGDNALLRTVWINVIVQYGAKIRTRTNLTMMSRYSTHPYLETLSFYGVLRTIRHLSLL